MTVSVEAHRRTLEELLQNHSLFSVLIALNRAVRSWTRCEETALALPGLQISPPDSTFLWLAAEAAKHAAIHCYPSSFDSRIILGTRKLDVRSLLLATFQAQADVPYLASDYLKTRLRTDPLRFLVPRLFAPQALPQRRSRLRVAHALSMYGDAPKLRSQRDRKFQLDIFSSALDSALGCDLESFCWICLQIEGRSELAQPHVSAQTLSPPPKDTRYDGTLVGRSTSSSLLVPKAQLVVATLSSEPTQIIKNMQEGWGETAGPWDFCAPNPLLRHPLVRVFRDRPDTCIAPVPSLVTDWLYEELAHILWLRLRERGAQSYLYQVFEEYVGIAADRCCPGGEDWLRESELEAHLPENVKVVDYAREFDDSVVLIEAKRSNLEHEALHRAGLSDWNNLEKSWSGAISQANSFWEAVQEGHVPVLNGAKAKNPILIVVGHSDTSYLFRGGAENEIRARLFKQPASMPTLFLSVDQYELVMDVWSTRDEGWLPRFLLKAAPDQVRTIDELALEPPGKLWEVVENSINRLQQSLDKEPRTMSRD
jgi:hypothetical protein